MARRSPKTSDAKRVSTQKHEVGYTGAKVAKATGRPPKAGRRAVRVAKKQTGSVKRRKVEGKAKRLI